MFVFEIINGEVSIMQESDISSIDDINNIIQHSIRSMVLILIGDWQQ